MSRPAAVPTSAEGIELPKSRLINHLSRLVNDLDALPDVVFVLNNGEDKVYAHKSILVVAPFSGSVSLPSLHTTHTHTQERRRAHTNALTHAHN
jgi:hypothetical protein